MAIDAVMPYRAFLVKKRAFADTKGGKKRPNFAEKPRSAVDSRWVVAPISPQGEGVGPFSGAFGGLEGPMREARAVLGGGGIFECRQSDGVLAGAIRFIEEPLSPPHYRGANMSLRED